MQEPFDAIFASLPDELRSNSKVDLYENYYWHYDEALNWMQARAELLKTKGAPSLAIGSHVPSTVTLGRHTCPSEVLDRDSLHEKGAIIRRVSRGGGVTLHQLGQLVSYPIFSLTGLGLSIPEYTFALEGVMITLLQHFGLCGTRSELGPGVYVDRAKIGFVGFHVSKGITSHGICLNVANDLSLYSHIVSCGVKEARITSLSTLLSQEFDIIHVGRLLIRGLLSEFFS